MIKERQSEILANSGAELLALNTDLKETDYRSAASERNVILPVYLPLSNV